MKSAVFFIKTVSADQRNGTNLDSKKEQEMTSIWCPTPCAIHPLNIPIILHSLFCRAMQHCHRLVARPNPHTDPDPGGWTGRGSRTAQRGRGRQRRDGPIGDGSANKKRLENDFWWLVAEEKHCEAGTKSTLRVHRKV